MSDTLGPRARQVYRVLHDRLQRGEYPPDSQLPAHTELAAAFGVATLTVRHVLAQLEEEGLISRELGRGTFVRPRPRPAVLIVDDDTIARTVLRSYVLKAGYAPLVAASPEEGLAVLRREELRSIALILSDVHMPDKEDGIGFITTVAHQWPEIPLAAVTAHPHDLDDLHGRPECPFLIVSKPFQAAQIAGLLRLAGQPSPIVPLPQRPDRTGGDLGSSFRAAPAEQQHIPPRQPDTGLQDMASSNTDTSKQPTLDNTPESDRHGHTDRRDQ